MGYSTDEVKLFEVIENLDSNKLVLPNFQREFVWGKSDQSSLLASFFVKLPIGSFLFLDGPKDEFPSKQIGRKKSLINYEDIDYNNVNFLLDGQQRITTLTTIFKDVFLEANNVQQFNEIHKDTFNVLQKRWFISADTKSFKDFFDFENLKFNLNQYKFTEPQDIEDMFKYLTINRSKDEDCWYNPLYRYNNSLDKNEYYDLVVDESSSDKLIPLFFVYEAYKQKKTGDIFNPDDTHLFRVLDKIASYHTGSLDSNKAYRWADNVFKYLLNILESNLHIIKVPRDERGRAIQIFEKINSGGTALDTFDLIVAKAADKKDENFKIYKSNKESLRNAIY